MFQHKTPLLFFQVGLPCAIGATTLGKRYFCVLSDLFVCFVQCHYCALKLRATEEKKKQQMCSDNNVMS